METPDEGWISIMGKDIMINRHRTTARDEDKEENEEGGTACMGTVVTCNLRGFLLPSKSIDDGSSALSKRSDTPFETLNNQKFKIGMYLYDDDDDHHHHHHDE